MGHCPFCKGAIQRELLVNGGTCPHCLIEIPGEEAATDPGEQAIARQQAEEAATKRRGPGLAAAVVLLALVAAGGGWLALRNAQPAVVELEEESFTPIPLDAHQNIFEEQPAAAGAQARGGGTAPAAGGAGAVVAATSLSNGGRGSGSAGPATGGQVDPVALSEPGRATLNPAAGSIAKQVEDVDPTAAASSPGGMVGPSITVGGRSAAETLTDPDAITEMIKRVVGRNSRQLQDCYNDRLKLAEDLEGRWRVGFEVQKNGSVSRIEVGGLGVADAELESCMTGRIASWRFSRIANPQQVSKTYSFTR